MLTLAAVLLFFSMEKVVVSMGIQRILVNDSVKLNKFTKIKPYRMSLPQEIEFRIDENEFSGFLVTITNKMDIHRESCPLLDLLLVLEANDQKLVFGCSHYIVQYFHSPLHLKFVSSVYESLSEHVTITITAIRFSCPSFHPTFRQCPNQRVFCIPRHLFCDGEDNCGLNSDEIDCHDIPVHYSISILDDRSQMEQYVITAFVFSFLMMSMIILIFAYRWQLARRQKYRRCVRNVFGESLKKTDSTEPEETVALLTLGLRTFLPHVAPMSKSKYRMSYSTMK